MNHDPQMTDDLTLSPGVRDALVALGFTIVIDELAPKPFRFIHTDSGVDACVGPRSEQRSFLAGVLSQVDPEALQ